MINRFRLSMAATVLILPLTASAHAKLLGTSPSAGATLAAAPKELRLDFNESVQLAVLKMSAAGKQISLPYDRATSASHVVVPLPVLGAGTYQVSWSALTVDDGHVVKGSFSFQIE
ncbi:MAG TPA: copper resistance CopC family protein [Steroidobacteraceae bacterium]|jgi:methionine-rich copper-binding protein CopC|nr:copper resistance CopC family protein [Steroidobacteraceae bacterium]